MRNISHQTVCHLQSKALYLIKFFMKFYTEKFHENVNAQGYFPPPWSVWVITLFEGIILSSTLRMSQILF
jgi:hypothetical protein